MKKVQHHSNTRVLGAPIGWDQKQLPCDALPITDAKIGGVACVNSYWQPEHDDLEVLKNGGFLILSVIGTTMPPVAITIVDGPAKG